MTEIDLKTALSVFSKFPQAKISFTLDRSLDLATGKVDEAGLPAQFAEAKFNAIEAQLGAMAARHHSAFFSELGPEHIASIRNFVRMLQTKTVAENKIVSALRGVGLREEQIRTALSLMALWAPGKIIPVAIGRGHDDFSLKTRELFELYLDGFLVREAVGRLTLVCMVLEPGKDRVLRILLSEIVRLDAHVKNAIPFWWAPEHEKMLHEVLLRRIPQLVLVPLSTMADLWSGVPPTEELQAYVKEKKLPEYLAYLFPFLVNGPTLPDPVADWSQESRESFIQRFREVYLELLGYWAFFYFYSKGSPGWKRNTDASDLLLKQLAVHFIQDAHLAQEAIPAEIRELVTHAMALCVSLPTPGGAKLRKEMRIDFPGNTTAVAKLSRIFQVGS